MASRLQVSNLERHRADVTTTGRPHNWEDRLRAARASLTSDLQRIPESSTYPDCQTVRRALEPLLYRDAARRRSDADIVALREILSTMEHHVDESTSYLRWSSILHRRIAQISSNVPLRTSYLSVLDFLEGRWGAATLPGYSCRRDFEHLREVVAAIERGAETRTRCSVGRHEGVNALA